MKKKRLLLPAIVALGMMLTLTGCFDSGGTASEAAGGSVSEVAAGSDENSGTATAVISGKVSLSSLLAKPGDKLQKMHAVPKGKPGSHTHSAALQKAGVGADSRFSGLPTRMAGDSVSNAVVQLFDADHPEWLFPVAEAPTDSAGNYTLETMINAEKNPGATYQNGDPIPAGNYTLVAIEKDAEGNIVSVANQDVVNSFTGNVVNDLVPQQVVETPPKVVTMFGVDKNTDGTQTWGSQDLTLFPNTALQITFSMAIDRQTVENGIVIEPAVNGFWAISPDGLTATLYLDEGEKLAQDTNYVVTVKGARGNDPDNALKNILGVALEDDALGYFRVPNGAQADLQAPTAQMVSPSLAEIASPDGVDLIIPIRIGATELMDVNDLRLRATPSLGDRPTAIYKGKKDGLYQYEFTLGKPLKVATTYDIVIDGGKDLAGNLMNKLEVSFTTVAASEGIVAIPENATEEEVEQLTKLANAQAEVKDVFGQWYRAMSDRDLAQMQKLMAIDFFMDYNVAGGYRKFDGNRDGRYDINEFGKRLSQDFKLWKSCGTTMTGDVVGDINVVGDEADFEFKLIGESEVNSRECAEAAPKESMFAKLQRINGKWTILKASEGIDTRNEEIRRAAIVELLEPPHGAELDMGADPATGEERTITFSWTEVPEAASYVMVFVDERDPASGFAMILPPSYTEFEIPPNEALFSGDNPVVADVSKKFGFTRDFDPRPGVEINWQVVALGSNTVQDILNERATSLPKDVIAVSKLSRFKIAGEYQELKISVAKASCDETTFDPTQTQQQGCEVTGEPVSFDEFIDGYDVDDAAFVQITVKTPRADATMGIVNVSGNTFQHYTYPIVNGVGSVFIQLNEGNNWIEVADQNFYAGVGGDPGVGCDPADPACVDPGVGCDPADPACVDPGMGCDPADPACVDPAMGCDPADPTCVDPAMGCDPADPTCVDPGMGCDPADPTCVDPAMGCDPADPTCVDPAMGCDPADPACVDPAMGCDPADPTCVDPGMNCDPAEDANCTVVSQSADGGAMPPPDGGAMPVEEPSYQLVEYFNIKTTGGIPPVVAVTSVTARGGVDADGNALADRVLADDGWSFYSAPSATSIIIAGTVNVTDFQFNELSLNLWNDRLGASSYRRVELGADGSFSVEVDIYQGDNWIDIGGEACESGVCNWYSANLGVNTDAGVEWVPPIAVTEVAYLNGEADGEVSERDSWGNGGNWEAVPRDLADPAVTVVIRGTLEYSSDPIDSSNVPRYNVGSEGGWSEGRIPVEPDGSFALEVELFDGWNNIGLTDVNGNWYGVNIFAEKGKKVVRPEIVALDGVPAEDALNDLGEYVTDQCSVTIEGNAMVGMVQVNWNGSGEQADGMWVGYWENASLETDEAGGFTVTLPLIGGSGYIWADNFIDINDANWNWMGVRVTTTADCGYTPPQMTVSEVIATMDPSTDTDDVVLSLVSEYGQSGRYGLVTTADPNGYDPVATGTVVIKGTSTVPGRTIRAENQACGISTKAGSTTASDVADASGEYPWSLEVTLYPGGNNINLMDGPNWYMVEVQADNDNPAPQPPLSIGSVVDDAGNVLSPVIDPQAPTDPSGCNDMSRYDAGSSATITISGVTSGTAPGQGEWNANGQFGRFDIAEDGSYAFQVSLYEGFNLININDADWNHQSLEVVASNGVLPPRFVVIEAPAHNASVDAGPVTVTGVVYAGPEGAADAGFRADFINGFVNSCGAGGCQWFEFSSDPNAAMWGALPIILGTDAEGNTTFTLEGAEVLANDDGSPGMTTIEVRADGVNADGSWAGHGMAIELNTGCADCPPRIWKPGQTAKPDAGRGAAQAIGAQRIRLMESRMGR